MAYKDKEGNTEPPFIKLYLDDLGKLNNLTGTQRNVLDLLMKYVKYGNEIIITKKLKDYILNELKIVEGSFKNALVVLVHKNIIIRKERRSNYIINPDIAFKGTVDDRYRLIITYNSSGERKIELEK